MKQDEKQYVPQKRLEYSIHTKETGSVNIE